MLYYNKGVNYSIKSIYEKKRFLLVFLVDTLTRFLILTFYKSVRFDTNIYH